MKKVMIVMLTILLLAGCGRKEAPQAIAEAAPPSIVSFEHMVEGNVLKISMLLAGGSGGIGYQLDRSEIDPHCQCPSFWRRFSETYPKPNNAGKTLSKMINLRTHEDVFAFRVRAVDALGRLGPWSKVVRAQAEEFFK